MFANTLTTEPSFVTIQLVGGAHPLEVLPRPRPPSTILPAALDERVGTRLSLRGGHLFVDGSASERLIRRLS